MIRKKLILTSKGHIATNIVAVAPITYPIEFKNPFIKDEQGITTKKISIQ